MSIAPAIRDNEGTTPCIEPHILGRLLDRLRDKIGSEQTVTPDPWQGIDRLARDMKEAQ